MSNDDNSLASALWIVVGGAAGYAAGRFVVDPWLATRPKLPHASSSTTRAASPAPRRPFDRRGRSAPVRRARCNRSIRMAHR